MKSTAAVLIAIAALAGPAGAQERVDEAFPSDARGSVEIVNVAGSVTVTAWDRNEIRVTGTLGRGTERLELDRDRQSARIRVVLPRNAGNVRGSDLEIRVPAGKNVTVRTVSADIGLSGVAGQVDVRSTSGDVTVQGQPAEVRAGSTSGDVEVDVSSGGRVSAQSTSGDVEVRGTVRQSVNVESVSGDVVVTATTPEVRAESVSGDLRLSGVSGRVSASTVSGDAVVSGDRIEYGSFESVSGSLRYTGGVTAGGALDLESHSGDVELVLPAGVSADFEAHTFSGSIQSDFGGEVQRTSRYGPGREMRLVTGRNGGRVRIQTFSGTVKLRRR
jgi:DUF4097 and DUF4098 domain-containing protein YvlB